MARIKTTLNRIFVFPGHQPVAKSVFGSVSRQAAQTACDVFLGCGFERKWLAKHQAKVRQTHRRVNAVVLEAPETMMERLQEDLKKKGHRVAAVKPVYPLLHESISVMDVAPMWHRGFAGRGVKVAVVDSGIDAKHPDFSERILAYKDFTGTGLTDRVGHGTHVAGIIAGAGSYYRGVAPQAQLIAAKVLDQAGTTDDVVLAGISWAARSGAQIINLSLGGPGDPDDVLSQECDALMREGIVVCVAAGNSGPSPRTISSPGTSRLAITVGAVDKEGKMTLYSSRGPVKDRSTKKDFIKPDLLACGGGYAHVVGCDYRAGVVSAKSCATKPGECSVVFSSEAAPSSGKNHSSSIYEKMSGTSMATPHVSGICALLLPVFRSPEGQSNSGLPVAIALKDTLLRATKSLGLKPAEQGAGLLSAALALQKAERFNSALPVDMRPWGTGETLSEGPGYKIKILTINPGSRLSLQYHRQRSENWLILDGKATVTSGPSQSRLETRVLGKGESWFVPVKELHRIENATHQPLLILEVQWGAMLKETDIVRLHDDFGRIGLARSR